MWDGRTFIIHQVPQWMGWGEGGVTQDHSQGSGLSSWPVEDLLPELGHLGRERLWDGVVNLEGGVQEVGGT